jgi:uncharacterized protein YndB with AHSA1/START domain
MSVSACPTDVVNAPAERIWQLITSPPEVARWTETRLVDGPNRPMQPGDRVTFRAGPGLYVVFRVLDADLPKRLVIDVDLPFGVVNHEVLQVSPLGEGGCRVTFG